MDDFRERPRSWTPDSAPPDAADKDASWGNFGSSMNAISVGFVATAILISMFLIMAIFEHLLRPRNSFLHSHIDAQESFGGQDEQNSSLGKLRNSHTVLEFCPSDLSVVMPGQRYPTCIAQPAPLPCPREGVQWPSHDHHALPSYEHQFHGHIVQESRMCVQRQHCQDHLAS